MSLKEWFLRRYIVDKVIPAVVLYGFKFHWLRRYRTMVGALFVAIGIMAQAPLPPDILVALHLTATVGTMIGSLGVYLVIIGRRFQNDPLPPAL